MKIFKIIATLVGCVIAPVVSVFLSYSLDVMLTTQKLKLFDFNTCLEGLKVNQKQQQLFMIFTALLIGLIIFVVFVAMNNKYKADTITVTPKIKIPVPAGEGQNGSARFMNDSEKHSVFATIAQKKQAIFYILPDQKTSYYPIVTLLVNQQYELLVDYAKDHGNRLPIRVNFFLDEFGNFTPISDIQAKLTVARGYGIRFNLFIQDMAQLEDKYDKNVANIIMGNCTVWVYLAAAGKETNELISSKLGKYTTLKYSSSGNKARYSNPSSGFSSQLEGRELLTADELARFARPYQLVMVLGEYPAVMVSYDLHKWQFNRFMGLGNESHNKQYIQIVTDSRQDKRNTNAKIPLWEVWKEQTPQAPQEIEYNYLLRRKEAKENNEKSETYDITKNAFYIAEDEVIDKGEDLFRRKE